MRYLNSQEYNTIVLAIHQYSGFVAHGGKGKSQEQFYKTLLVLKSFLTTVIIFLS